jgi:hypothetical protein
MGHLGRLLVEVGSADITAKDGLLIIWKKWQKNKVSNINDYLCRVEVCFYCKRKPQPD